ncbi:barnase inhibitor [Streptomyces solincola]|uniref:Barnase inhibitor n=1 Tax=Streptomyces solincola TaxID=2100817 RepID=A0A2S9Q0C5_9ACTN|nr:barstar family protein [Streptomyces solincola]PRH80135.1 barnase inhibitor [Streptomyces solincola]
MRIEIDGARVQEVLDVHRALAGPLDFGPYYGWNLSALWDRLSTDVERPVDIVWKDAAVSRRVLGSVVFEGVRDVLLRAEAQDREFGWKNRITVTIVE